MRAITKKPLSEVHDALRIKVDSKDNIITFTSNDNADADVWTDVSVLKSGDSHKKLFEKISTMFKNVRFFVQENKEN